MDKSDMSHHGSASNLNRWGPASYMYSNHDTNSAMYRSSPNLSQGSHTRSSSNDSLDAGSGGLGAHSRQSSGSTENYSTRRLSSSGRPNATASALQFVKLPGSNPLAQAAQKQIKISEESKKVKWDTLIETEDTDWQSKLGNWKSKRRTKSSTSYDHKEEAEAEEKEAEEKALRSTKTFREIVEERDQRKSVNTYPIEDENDEYTANSQSKDINHNRTESARSTLSTGSLDDSSTFDSQPWVASSDDDTYKTTPQSDSRVGNGVPSESDTESNKENWGGHNDSHNNNNNTETTLQDKYSAPTISSHKQSDINSEPSQRRISSKLSSIRQAFEDQAESDMEYKPLARVSRSPDKYATNNNQTKVLDQPKVSPRSTRSDKDSVERSITISQKPDSEKGFGFTFTGGRDVGQPAVVERVSLGGAADVCEVRVNDEIIEVNRRKVSTYTHTQIEDIVKRAVRTGKLELKVKRYIRKGAYLSDEFSEEDSFDRFEEQLAKEQEMQANTKNDSSALTPMMDSLLRENHHDADQNTDNRASWEDSEEKDDHTYRHTDRHDNRDTAYTPEPHEVHRSPEISKEVSRFSPEQMQREITPPPSADPPQPVEEPMFSPVVRTRPQTVPAFKHAYTPYSPDSDYQPASVVTAQPGKPIHFDVRVPERGESPSSEESPPTEGSGFGPPKALLRWQRRPRSQYEDMEDEKPQPKETNQRLFSVDVSQSTTTSQSPAPIETELEIRPTVVPRARLDLSRELKKMEEWDKQQQQQRQPTAPSPAKREFEENVEGMNSRWHTEQQQAHLREQQKSQKDKLILEEERRRVVEMEEKKSERKAQRQAKLAQLAEQQQHTPVSPQIVSASPFRPQQTSEMVVRLPDQSQYGLQIDPANRPDLTLNTHERYQEVNFRVSFSPQSPGAVSRPAFTADPGNQYGVEEERLRLQLEEREMRRRLEEEKATEERRLREREEHIRRQEDRLRQEEERLRLEQERLQRERQQHLQERISPRGESPASLSKLSPSYPSSSPSSLSPPFNSQPEADQQFSSTVVIANSAPNNFYVKSVQHAPYKSPFTSSTSANTKPSERLTREDLMAMSRSARPLEEKPPSLQQPETADPPVPQSPVSRKPASLSAPLVREAPSKQEKHSLNAAPKPRLQASAGWIGQEEEERDKGRQAAPRPARRSDIMRQHYSSTQDHWLVQEAERRRLEEGQRTSNRPAPYRNGPIKPHDSLTTNRWRDARPQKNTTNVKPNMRTSTAFEQMRQKFTEPASESDSIRPTNPALQPRAAPRLSSSAPSWQPHSSANSASLGPNSPLANQTSHISPKPAPRSRASPVAPGNSPEPTMAVSGRQRCSHCKEELGYGAAMVIESLNLHYHMQCFRCCVCRTQLGNGAEGADVRVRGWKLHCRNCYSNDEAGLKFSKV